jgi:hypothetical protein
MGGQRRTWAEGRDDVSADALLHVHDTAPAQDAETCTTSGRVGEVLKDMRSTLLQGRHRPRSTAQAPQRQARVVAAVGGTVEDADGAEIREQAVGGRHRQPSHPCHLRDGVLLAAEERQQDGIDPADE